jgi:hypothetical protein
MANIQRNFIKGRMNKSLDERLIPNGEYIDAHYLLLMVLLLVLKLDASEL